MKTITVTIASLITALLSAQTEKPIQLFANFKPETIFSSKWSLEHTRNIEKTQQLSILVTQ